MSFGKGKIVTTVKEHIVYILSKSNFMSYIMRKDFVNV